MVEGRSRGKGGGEKEEDVVAMEKEGIYGE